MKRTLFCLASLFATFGVQAGAVRNESAEARPPIFSILAAGNDQLTFAVDKAGEAELAEIISSLVSADAPLQVSTDGSVLAVTVSEDALRLPDRQEMARRLQGDGGVLKASDSKAFWDKQTFCARYRWVWESNTDDYHFHEIRIRGGMVAAMSFFVGIYRPGLVSSLAVRKTSCPF